MILKHGLLRLAIAGSLAVLVAPVVAGSGWLLLAPPELARLVEGDTGSAVNAPLDRWRQVQAFDTARECERSKNEEWSRELKEIETLRPYPPYPRPPKTKESLQAQAAPKDKEARGGLREMIRKYLEEDEKAEAMMTEDQRQKLEQERQEWSRETDKIDAARAPKQRAVNELYRPWKCVPADAVYRAPR